MKRIPPSEKIRQRIDELLTDGLDTEKEITSVLVELGVKGVLQEMLEEEMKDYLGRDYYARREPDQEHRGYRNVYEPLRQQGGGKEGVLCAWSICADGRKERHLHCRKGKHIQNRLLHVAVLTGNLGLDRPV